MRVPYVFTGCLCVSAWRSSALTARMLPLFQIETDENTILSGLWVDTKISNTLDSPYEAMLLSVFSELLVSGTWMGLWREFFIRAISTDTIPLVCHNTLFDNHQCPQLHLLSRIAWSIPKRHVLQPESLLPLLPLRGLPPRWLPVKPARRVSRL